jgi:hypothetical protein
VVGLLHFLQHFIEVETRGLLTLGKLGKSSKKLRDKSLCRHQQENVINQPVIVGD